jgi:hypothetical protein
MVAERIRRAGYEIFLIPLEGTTPVSQALCRLRTELGNQHASALVWVSLVDLMCFAFGMRMATTQVWWAMKYHGLQFPEIDGYLTGGSIAGGRKGIDDNEWRVGPVLTTDLLGSYTESELDSIAGQYSTAQIIFGCFGREEKLTDTFFLNAICEILRQVPVGVFLWTGRNQHPVVQTAFEEAGVANRCHFIGWVDTKLYAKVIDVFLDSFPFPCGYTLYEAMAVGRPIVLYSSAESDQTGLHAIVAPLLFGTDGSAEDRTELQAIFRHEQDRDLYLRASTPDDYVRFAVQLAGDNNFRRLAGVASRKFVERFMLNRERTGRIYAQHLLEMIATTGKETRRDGVAPQS